MAVSNVADVEDIGGSRAQFDVNRENPRENASAVSWSAILAGAAAALSLILLLLGAGLGLSSVSPWSQAGISAATFGVSTILWVTVTQLIAAGMGGYLAGRLRTRWIAVHSDEVYFRDTAHGFLAWAMATLATAAMLGSVIGSIVGGGVQAGASVTGGIAATATAAAAGGVAATGSQTAKDAGDSAPLEEEIFYPAVKLALKDKELVPEATVEHATLKALIAQVEGVMPDGEMFDAKIKVLSEYVKHHVKEEQNEMFPKASASKLDMMELGEKLSARKAELIGQRS